MCDALEDPVPRSHVSMVEVEDGEVPKKTAPNRSWGGFLRNNTTFFVFDLCWGSPKTTVELVLLRDD